MRREQLKLQEDQSKASLEELEYIQQIKRLNESIVQNLYSDISSALDAFKVMSASAVALNPDEKLDRRDVSFTSTKAFENWPLIFKSIREELFAREEEIAIALKDYFWYDFCHVVKIPVDDALANRIHRGGESLVYIDKVHSFKVLYEKVISLVMKELTSMKHTNQSDIIATYEAWARNKYDEHDPEFRFVNHILEQEDSTFTEKTLISARSLILNDDFSVHDIEEVSISQESKDVFHNTDFLPDDLWLYPKSQCRQTTIDLLDIVNLLLETARLQQSSTRIKRLCETVSELFEIYIAISPYVLSDKLESSPGIAMLFYNDCMYISHRLKKISIIMNPQLSPYLDKPFSLNSYAMRIEEIGKRKFQLHMNFQKDQLLSTFNQGGFLSTSRDLEVIPYEQKEKMDNTIILLLFQYRKIAKTIKPILPIDTYHQYMGHIIGNLCSYINTHLLIASDVTVLESEIFYSYFRQLFDLENLFDAGYDPCLYISGWRKFKVLIPMMDMKMVDIVSQFNQNPNITKLELIHMIEALFSDSSLRKEQIKLIKSETS